MKKNIKILIAICAVIAVILVIILVVVNNNNGKENQNIKNTNEIKEQVPVSTTRKMAKYIDLINGDYYMKYKTTSSNSGSSEEPETLTTEYAISNNRVYMNYVEHLTSILISKEGTYYIMNGEKIIIEYPVEEGQQAGFSGFQQRYTQQFFEENFRGTGTEDIEDIAYYYEEYSDNYTDGGKIRYYFDENDILRYINNITTSGEEWTQILEFTDIVKEELFKLPEGYTKTNLSEYMEKNSSVNH